jgi:hypothetical protein
MRILFYASHTLYTKSLIPLILELSKQRKIYIATNRFNFMNYSPQTNMTKPTANRYVNKSSYEYVSNLLFIKEHWTEKKNIKFKFKPLIMGYDLVISTIKDAGKLSKYANIFPKTKFLFVGYQHMPFALSRNFIFEKKIDINEKNIFLSNNEFNKKHKFKEFIDNVKADDILFCGFPHIHSIKKHFLQKQNKKDKKYVLIFHPGGYRDVFTAEGETKSKCFSIQKEIFQELCIPILTKGLIPVIKIHPLAAQYHFQKDIEKIINEITLNNIDFNQVIIENDNYFKYLDETKYIVLFGSSGVYELFSLGIKNLLICDFYGKDRSSKFKFFNDVFISSIDEYKKIFNNLQEININEATLYHDVYSSYMKTNEKQLADLLLSNIKRLT